MATTLKSITDSWTAITSAGQSGTCWVTKIPTDGRVLIDHSTTGTGALSVTKSYSLPENKEVITPINADDVSDIYYAICSKAGETASLTVDVI